MIVEDYVSFETAKLLKENGFNHWCYKCYGTAVYHKGVPISFDEECDLKSEGLENEIEYVEGGYLYDFGCDNRKKDAKVWAAPTLQIARKWIKEKYKRHIEVRITNHSISDMVNVIRYYWIIFDAETARWMDESTIYKIGGIYKTGVFDTEEQAYESALRHILENIENYDENNERKKRD